ncbi:MAG TPA: phosphatase PAP2 family protein [Pyrinomonadaceae bacterium]|nr:phosphatase PAP2 family protein [Pyrinomonadaceae bacterium]
MSDQPTHDHFFGGQLLLGLLLFIGMTLTLAALAEHVMTGRPLTIVDQQLSEWLVRSRTPALTTFFIVVTSLGSTAVGVIVAAVLGVYLLLRGQRYWLAATTLSIGGGMLLNRLLKVAFQRARPELDDPIRTFAGYSFPSGHTVTATVVFGTLALLLFVRVRSLRARATVLVLASLVIVMVGFSRIYLGAHYLTDVLAAIAEGIAWVSLSFTVVTFLKRRRTSRTVA